MADNKIYSADKAREMTDNTIKLDDSELYPIMDKIKEATKKKEYCCYISGCTKDYIIDKLHALGYKTKLHNGCPSDPRERDVYEISWK